MVKFAETWMVPQLKKIWKECFHDEDTYIDFFFSRRFCCENCLVWTEGDTAAAMLHMLPASLVYNGVLKPIRYVYAVGTLPQFRKRGISNRLLEYGNEWMEKRGESSILVPATDSLFGFYSRQGYTPSFSLKNVLLGFSGEEEDCGTLEHQKVKPEKYKEIRDRHFMKDGYVAWDLDAIGYALSEHEFTGGFSLCFTYRKSGLKPCDGVVLGRVSEGKLHIKEIACEDSVLPEVLSLICKDMGVREVQIRLPVYSQIDGVPLSYGMASIPGISEGYLGLALD